MARDVSIALPRGARHALIGPNGAGKTTLINLITGQIQPDAGRILLDGDDITGMARAKRVKAGLTRTFQINTLFPDLTPIEAVMLAVCERKGTAGQFWRGLTAHGEAIDEAFAILRAAAASATSRRGRPASSPTASSGCSRSRWRWRPGPRCCLLDEPAAGVPKGESAELFAVIAALPDDISVLFIEHDMNLVFRFASRIIVLVSGGVLLEAEPDVIRTDPRVREVYLGQTHHG